MSMANQVSRRSLLGLAALGAGALGGCDDSSDTGGSGSGTLTWWHIATTEPVRSLYAGMARDFEAANPGTKIEVVPLENEAFKSKLTTVTQAGDPPDIFHTWGGGVLRQQAEAGLIKDLTTTIAPWKGSFNRTAITPYTIDGKDRAVAVDTGMVGFWYNRALFAAAGITTPPGTWTEFLSVVRRLKAAGTVPIALAGKEKWPGHYYWAYLAMRVAGLGGLNQAAKDKSFESPDFVAAGSHLADLVALQPFQPGFLAAGYATPDGQSATVANRKAAMELMGQWAPSSHVSTAADGKGLGADLGFFPFPVVAGGKGVATEVFGGGGGFAVGRDAPAKATDFLKFISTVERQRVLAAKGSMIPTVTGAEDALTDPQLQVVARTLAAATGFQLYLDQAYPPAIGAQVNDSVADLLAGKANPTQVVRAITEAARR